MRLFKKKEEKKNELKNSEMYCTEIKDLKEKLNKARKQEFTELLSKGDIRPGMYGRIDIEKLKEPLYDLYVKEYITTEYRDYDSRDYWKQQEIKYEADIHAEREFKRIYITNVFTLNGIKYATISTIKIILKDKTETLIIPFIPVDILSFYWDDNHSFFGRD